MHRRKRFIFFYLVLDILAALLAWMTLYYFRKFYIEHFKADIETPFRDTNFYIGLIVIPQIWVLLHYFTGTYVDVFRKSRLQEFLKTLLVTLVGCVIIFFAFLLDDLVKEYKDYYLTFLALFFAQLLFSISLRFSYLNYTKFLIRSGRIGFNTLIVGTQIKVEEVMKSLAIDKRFGLVLKGISFTDNGEHNVIHDVQSISLSAIDSFIVNERIEEVILAVNTEQHAELTNLMHSVGDRNVFIKIIPDMYDILSRTVKMNHVVGEAFIEIPPVLIDEWERIGKRWFDVIASVLAMLITFPVWLVVMVLIKLDSEGSVFYLQERLGQYGKPFFIMKFRSMRNDAEAQGPKLTSNADPRITKVGLWMRKFRVDELPQFINVIKGDMSIVGPRAERKYFAEQIEKVVPQYTHVFKVKPGITSLGMVKYGYASTVEEMVKRLKYDLIYIENMSIVMDLKILIYTVKTVVYGKGK
jgi:exopolysaccharide biosynthesis polyprenyl glycosylphosphotransferase